MSADKGVAAELRDLLGRAREQGRLAELVPILREALAAAGEPAAADTGASRAFRSPLAPELSEPKERPPGRFGLVGDSPQMRRLFELVERVAPSEVPVLVEGETGTGKELVARALHERSARRGRPFVAVNCAAVPASLLESELFGHKKGSFTGAVADRVGCFAAADGGTLFLDEIGDTPIEMQAKLLRVLEQGEIRPVGADRTAKVDVRVVAATNRDLAALVRERRFREDLFYRLNVVRIALPPLREREGDVRLLARHLLASLAADEGAPRRLSPEAEETLASWAWPGNVRELENELRRAAALGGETIGPDDLSPRIRQGAT